MTSTTAEQQCVASSWCHGRKPGNYGPGGFNRCVQTGEHQTHEDQWGTRWSMIDGKWARHA